MYIPDYFKNENIVEIKNFLNENSFGILLTQIDGKIFGTHIPMLLDTNENGKSVLVGHISKANLQSKNLKDKEEVLAIFNGPHSYISSSWYQRENVPTWNYIAVHIYGRIKIIKGQELFTALEKLINKYEQKSQHPISMEGLSEQTLKQIKEIVGFSIEINEIQAAYKLSQNRSEKDFYNIIVELIKSGDSNSMKIANEMKKIKL